MVTLIHDLIIQPKFLGSAAPHIVIPAIGQQDASDV
jgi:hypothetical protein